MRDEPFPYPAETRYLLQETLNACEEIHASLSNAFEKTPHTAALKIPAAHKPAENPTRIFDQQAEEWLETHIRTYFSDPIEVIGEENPGLASANFTSSRQTVFLVDMVDGSDLAMTGLANWCSAVVCFSPPRDQILFAIVAHCNGWRYFATTEQPGAFADIPLPARDGEFAKKRRRIPIAVNKHVKSMAQARICSYGQKWKKTLVADDSLYIALGDGGRFYNFAGNPMMAKLAEGKIDAVFDIGGQKAYDVVPGAYIALRAGAVMSTPEGHRISERDLYEKLLTPSRKVRYVVSGTEELRLELCSHLVNARTLEQKLDRASANK